MIMRPSQLVLSWIATHNVIAGGTNSSDQDGVIGILPSYRWEGIDGAWSTFEIQVGTPGQNVRLLPGTADNEGNSVWVVLPHACTEINEGEGIPNCADKRGGTFESNESTTWSIEKLPNNGLFSLDTGDEEAPLGLKGTAYYDFDTVQLGINGSGKPMLQNQLVAEMGSRDFWLGSLGISAIAFNFSTLNDPIPSMLTSLREQNLIRSTTWGYTAGQYYQSPPLTGSLTLGGYDAARFAANTSLVVSAGVDFRNDISIGLQSITYDSFGSSPLLASGINAWINSMVPEMWLPVDVCQAFEKAFNLTWNATEEVYLLDEKVHASLKAQNPTLTFTLGAADSGGDTIEIKFPYAAFDLNATAPFANVSSPTPYFPLKRAANSSQYVLGRTFLQEVYIIADYERSEFRISQAQFANDGMIQNLTAIDPPGSQNGTTSGSRKGVHLSGGAIAGIAVASVAGLCLVVTGLALIRIRRRRQRKAEMDAKDAFAKKGADGGTLGMVQELGASNTSELAGSGGKHELLTEEHAKELQDSGIVVPCELDAGHNGAELEMPKRPERT